VSFLRIRRDGTPFGISEDAPCAAHDWTDRSLPPALVDDHPGRHLARLSRRRWDIGAGRHWPIGHFWTVRVLQVQTSA
jgi:hypothetical protein